MTKIYHKANFHKHTFCVWQEVVPESIAALQVQYKSESGSQYIFTPTGVYRISNHWGRAANCRWRLQPLTGYRNQQTKVGYANWSDFYPNDDSAKLFFIALQPEDKTVTFYHKDYPIEREGAVLRNATDTAKRIATLKKVLTETDWARNLNFEDLEALRASISNELIMTDNTFIAIKQKHHQD